MGITKKEISTLFKPFIAVITSAAEAVVAAEEKVTLTRTALGREVGKAVAALTSAGASGDEAKDLVMETIVKVAQDLVDWKTVQGWVRASVVEDSLPEELREQFSTEALVTIGQIPEEPKKEGAIDRATFATNMAEKGVSSVRALREEVRTEKEKTAPASKNAAGTATQAAQAVKTGQQHLRANPLPADPSEDFLATFVAVGELGNAIGKKHPTFRSGAVHNALEELVTDWLIETGQMEAPVTSDAEVEELVAA